MFAPILVRHMVQFADPRAWMRSRDAAGLRGIRWFHEPGAWVERTPLRPAGAPRITLTRTDLRLRWTWND